MKSFRIIWAVGTAAAFSIVGCGGDEPLRGWADADVEIVEEGEASGQSDVIISGSDVIEPMRNTDLDTTDSLEIVEDEGIVLETDGEGGDGTLKSSLEPQEVDPDLSERMPAQLGSPTPSAASRPSSSSSPAGSGESTPARRSEPSGGGSATQSATRQASPPSEPEQPRPEQTESPQRPEPGEPEPAEETAEPQPEPEEEEEEPQSDEPQFVTSIRR